MTRRKLSLWCFVLKWHICRFGASFYKVMPYLSDWTSEGYGVLVILVHLFRICCVCQIGASLQEMLYLSDWCISSWYGVGITLLYLQDKSSDAAAKKILMSNNDVKCNDSLMDGEPVYRCELAKINLLTCLHQYLWSLTSASLCVSLTKYATFECIESLADVRPIRRT